MNVIQVLTSSPLFGVCLTILAYEVGCILNRKLKTPVANPLLIAVVLIIVLLKLLGVSFDTYNQGGSIITLFLAPATASLAVNIYAQLEQLKKRLLPVLAGALVGSVCSVGSILLLSHLFGLDESLTASLIPKSVTTPIAMSVSQQLGGIVPVTVAAVVVTGIVGGVFAPTFIRLFPVKDPAAGGLAMGVSSHALGTTKALEIGEVEGAMSGIAIGIAGLITVILAQFLA